MFPGLKLEGRRKDLFAQTQVERVTATRAKDFVRVYLASDHLILKEDVFAVEKEIQKQLFPGMRITVRFYERFHLSSQFSPETLLEAYRESILLELSHYSHLLFSMFKHAEISFPREGQMRLLIEDTVLARSKSGELEQILEKIFGERCGLPVMVSFDYKEAKAGRFKEEDEILMSRRIAEIAARYQGRGGQTADPAGGVMQKTKGGGNIRPFPGKEGGPQPEAGSVSGRPGRLTAASADGGFADGAGLPESPQADTAYEAYLAGMAQQEAAASGAAGASAGAAGAGRNSAGAAGVSGGAAGTSGGAQNAGGREGRFAGKRSGGFPRRRGGDGDFYRSPKRSDNPDVIYGRD